jgi:hypothetical protein
MAAMKIVTVLGLASLWAQDPNTLQTPKTACPPLASPIHLTRGYLDGVWWQAALPQERRVYVEGYLDARGFAKRRYSLAIAFLDDFYSDATLRNIRVRDALGVYLGNSHPARRK